MTFIYSSECFCRVVVSNGDCSLYSCSRRSRLFIFSCSYREIQFDLLKLKLPLGIIIEQRLNCIVNIDTKYFLREQRPNIDVLFLKMEIIVLTVFCLKC